jgi:glucose-1-phosphate thymidylyltransferase
VTEIVEKPKQPKSDLAVVGLYIFDNSVYDKILDQKPSERGEYEITYINNKYIDEGTLESVILNEEWFDIGTIDSLHEASVYMYNKNGNAEKKQ